MKDIKKEIRAKTKQLLNITEVSKHLKVSEQTVLEMIDIGLLTCKIELNGK